MNSKYHYERIRFIKKHGEQPVIKISDAIAEFLWYSVAKTHKALRSLSPEVRADAVRLLRYAQNNRTEVPKEMQELWDSVQWRKQGQGFFDLSTVRPAAYMHPVQRLEVAGEFAGITTHSERIKGGKIRVHYSSKETGLKLKKIELRDNASEFLKSQGLHAWQAVYHCEK